MSTDNGPAGTQPADTNSGFRGWLRDNGVPALVGLVLVGGVLTVDHMIVDDYGDTSGDGQAGCQVVQSFDPILGLVSSCAVGSGAGGGGGGSW